MVDSTEGYTYGWLCIVVSVKGRLKLRKPRQSVFLAFDVEHLRRNGDMIQLLFHDAYLGGSVDDGLETIQRNIFHMSKDKGVSKWKIKLKIILT